MLDPSLCAMDISTLPFNRSCLDDCFQLLSPDRDPGGEGVWLLLQGMHLLTDKGAPERLPSGDCPLPSLADGAQYLGQWQGQPCRLIEVPGEAALPATLEPYHLRAVEPTLSAPMSSLGGIGLMVLHWEATSRYCGNCDGKMERLAGGWGKICLQCGAHHFPRIHPCVIGLILRGDHLLLVRKGEWATGRYGLVAGFVEFGESLEEAMAREVLEETGISIANIRYLGSQSWPFPSQLMCGFVADYAGGDIELRDQELCAADWYRLDKLPTLPPSRSIARFLIDRADQLVKS
ncbi:MAG: NAD(+) diphosphatase [Pelovirga sp.]